ncbi:hypothetical protein GCM10011608_61510 [Micromonospora sonchi]|uniref:Uncharacterized protein n=1 Tax=Micromonospora sonchi TaxID=1763543 RepID=A0A917X415_9ACTN|nr:hypothetical protein GCM10011608_61510 [Micromonospora sonchi]
MITDFVPVSLPHVLTVTYWRTLLGGRGCQKRIEQVIADLVEHRLAAPVATTIPLVTYKTADVGLGRGGRKRGRR